ncbi:LysM domain-containing protein [Rubritalea squalenifaciens DSM 18772]|uniref:LysM domain-containing protein n=2 Tax=Rubritalea TaxID=361050 RepID=A0A1M6PEJ7_9BACT|nr:LysM domain-containing protein [Rubritalea squalenifaciens]SHK06344.1 LysM domain-containing protein [Rubritalea squalenifaciens DSM 18772]
MKDDRLQTKRQTKKGFRVLQAKMTRRKQRVSAAATADSLDQDVPNVGVGRALTVILALHVVAIAAIFIGTQWNDRELATVEEAAPASVDISKVNTKLDTAFVHTGDTYEAFAARHGVDVNELRKLNNDMILRAGVRLTIPENKISNVAPAVANQGAVQLDDNAREVAVSERPPVGALPVENVEETPKAVLVTPRGRPNIPRAIPVAEPVASNGSYVVQSGDTVWRISQKFHVSQDELLKLNGLSDPRKLKVGDKLIIPAN